MSLLQNSNAISTGGAYNLESSLRFRSSANAYLSRTPASAGNRKTWTWSAWFKRGQLPSATSSLFGSGTSGGDYCYLGFNSSEILQFQNNASGGNQINATTPAVFRDVSAWYHIVLSVDTTQATNSNGIKIYINGVQQTLSFTSYTQNTDTLINNTNTHVIGDYISGGSLNFDGYMTEVNFVDGQALTADDFGETDTTTGVWKPKRYAGTYGTNGFYLPMKETQQATGFNTVLYTGSSAAQSISNVGFSPDLVWIKNRTSANNHILTDSVRGATKTLISDSISAELTVSQGLTSFNNNGFSVGYDGSSIVNFPSNNYVAWCWDAGSSTVSNTDGTITSSVRANPASGFSIVTFNAAASGAFTVGHGLGTAPKVVITRYRNIASDWYTYHESVGNTKFLKLNDAAGETTSSTIWDNTSPTSDVFTLGSSIAGSSSWTMVAYCFSEVSGFSKFGSYTGNGSTSGPTVTTGFRPALVMIKSTTTAGSNWWLADNTRDVSNPNNALLFPNLSNAEYTTAGVEIDFNDTGFQLKTSSPDGNKSGDTFIYMAFADTRDFQWNFDVSGNKNNWTPNNINSNASSESTYDLMSDVPTLTDEDTANFATLNPISGTATLSNGNLQTTSSSGWQTRPATIVPNSGKFYAESVIGNALSSGGYYNEFGVTLTSDNIVSPTTYISSVSNGYAVQVKPSSADYWTNNTVTTSLSGSYSSGSVMQIAIDLDAGKCWLGCDNGWIGGGNPSTGTSPTFTFTVNLFALFGASNFSSTGINNTNFGQRPFVYTPPTGFKKLNTYNLPDSSITDGSQYMNPVLYTGTGTSSFSITGVGFSPDLVWVKQRNIAQDHALNDSVRGAGKILFSNATAAEYTATTYGQISSFDSDGFTASKGSDPTYSYFNQSGGSYVAWNWRGSDSTAVSNTDGTITSTVSANPTSGFSIVTYTGTGANATVGHGLGVAPSFIIVKLYNTIGAWKIYHSSLGATQAIEFTTGASATNSIYWNNTAPTNFVFTAGTAGAINSSGNNHVAYCFAEVEGFSKFGSYTGNGSADGPFIYTGFRPAFILVKRTDTASYDWFIYDTSRDTYNVASNYLRPNLSNAEDIGATYDILSNGFKNKSNFLAINASGGTYIYMAFAENPFKNSLAR